MADNEFDLGEAYSSYEQAQADRNFYLSMMQQGQQNRGAFMASPIAAYLAGISSVKMANERAKVQNIEDKMQAKKDALEATERLNKRASDLDKQILQVAEGVGNGTIAPGIGAAMMGPLMKERGYTLKNYDTDNNIAVYTDPTDMQDYEFDFKARPSQLEDGRQARAEARIGWEREKQRLEAKLKKELVARKQSSSGTEKYTTLSSFNTTHKDVLQALGRESRLKRLTQGQIKDFVEGVESLSPKDKEQMKSKVNDVLNFVAEKHPNWKFSSTSPAPVVMDLNDIYNRS